MNSPNTPPLTGLDTDAPGAIHLLADAMPQLVFSARPDGFHDYFNRKWYEYTGRTLEQTQGEGWEDLLHPEDRDRCHAAWARSLATGEPYEIEYRFRRASDGAYRWFLGRALPIRGAAGQILRWFGTCTDIDDQKRAEQEIALRAERETLVNRISLAIRSTLDAAVIQREVVTAVGEALGADRCYFATYDPRQDRAVIGGDWHGEQVPSVAGEYRLSDFRPVLGELWASDSTAVVADLTEAEFSVATTTVLEQFGGRALLAVPLYDRGQLVAALYAATLREPRVWSDNDIALVEEVATLTRSALELARLHERERNIANTLQGALQPDVPSSVPGLDLDFFYRPALDEASVGGDFADVFPVEKGCYALVVGDLSGKGLAAAAQVATVRNMLRYALYTGQTLAEAVTRLNNILISNSLLTGFATLAVLTYDVGLRNITYVSCGQEPTLLRRTVQGDVEELPPTGPILGANESAVYQEQRLSLTPGDVFALYTDGLTETGPDRRRLLGVNGLAELMRSGSGTASDMVGHMIQGVEAYSGGVFRDDVCLLVGVVQASDFGLTP